MSWKIKCQNLREKLSPYFKYGFTLEKKFPPSSIFYSRRGAYQRYEELYNQHVEQQHRQWAHLSSALNSLDIGTSDVPLASIDRYAKTLQVSIKASDPNWVHGYVLWSLAKHVFGNTPEGFWLEIGTAKGFSAAVIDLAVRTASACNRGISIDVLPHGVPMYWNSMADSKGQCSRRELLQVLGVNCNNILFLQQYSERAASVVGVSRIPMAFIDGQHTYEAVANELLWVTGVQNSGDWLLIDDCNRDLFPGVALAVSEVQKAENYVVNHLDLGGGREMALCRKK